MHAAQLDAQLTCFETKYHYFVIRPSQAEPLISLVIPLPNYPAYLSVGRLDRERPVGARHRLGVLPVARQPTREAAGVEASITGL